MHQILAIILLNTITKIRCTVLYLGPRTCRGNVLPIDSVVATIINSKLYQ